jgi:hypothetical protein
MDTPSSRQFSDRTSACASVVIGKGVGVPLRRVARRIHGHDRVFRSQRKVSRHQHGDRCERGSGRTSDDAGAPRQTNLGGRLGFGRRSCRRATALFLAPVRTGIGMGAGLSDTPLEAHIVRGAFQGRRTSAAIRSPLGSAVVQTGTKNAPFNNESSWRCSRARRFRHASPRCVSLTSTRRRSVRLSVRLTRPADSHRETSDTTPCCCA